MRAAGEFPWPSCCGTREELLKTGVATESGFQSMEQDGFGLFIDAFGRECSIIAAPGQPGEYLVTSYGTADEDAMRILAGRTPDDIDVSEIIERVSK